MSGGKGTSAVQHLPRNPELDSVACGTFGLRFGIVDIGWGPNSVMSYYVVPEAFQEKGKTQVVSFGGPESDKKGPVCAWKTSAQRPRYE